eukprot:1336979-Pleurochrysis_carterae.AAC.1
MLQQSLLKAVPPHQYACVCGARQVAQSLRVVGSEILLVRDRDEGDRVGHAVREEQPATHGRTAALPHMMPGASALV